MSREDPQIRVRLDIDLKLKLHRSARENNRSFTAEVNARLIDSYKQHSPAPEYQSIQEQLDAIAKHLGVNASKK